MNWYAEAIEIIADLSIDDARKIALEAAKRHPKLVVQTVRGAGGWLSDVDASLRNDKKIQAIKIWRANTHLGLKEAKDAVEQRQQVLGLAA